MNLNNSDDTSNISVLNPVDNSVVGSVNNGTPEDVEKAVDKSQSAFSAWAKVDPVDRGKILFSAASVIRSDLLNLATLLTKEQGKPLRESKNEVAGFARILEYYASVSGSIRGEYSSSKLYGHSFVARNPIGVCGAIIPWNMPVLIMGWKIGPALVTGNTMVLKPATSAPLTCMALASHMVKAGLPESVLNIVTGRGKVVGEALAKNKNIRSLSFTGEINTGIRVSTLAAPTMKRLTLELGGSDPMIVCADADLEKAAAGAVSGRFYNCGQTCTAVKRVFVDDEIAEKFLSLVKNRISKLTTGDGLTRVDMGPMHSAKQRERLISQIERTVSGDMGKIVNTTRSDIRGPGNFMNPVLMTDVSEDAPVFSEEVFGPILPVFVYNTLDDAITEANNTRFGLGSSIWTHDIRNITKAVNEIESGIVWINQHLKIPPEVPFGGIKASGLSKENGIRALDNYLLEKTILIRSE